MTNLVNHPPHYNSHPSGVEAVELCEWLGFNLGNALKYAWRAGLKGSRRQDLEKVVWYIRREAGRRFSPGPPRFGGDLSRARLVINSDPGSLLAQLVAVLCLSSPVTADRLETAEHLILQELERLPKLLDDLELSLRAANACQAAGLRYVSELTDENLFRLQARGVSDKTVQELKEARCSSKSG